MRKPTAILLLTVFCNSLFYYGYFSFSILKAKWEARLALAKMSPQASPGILKVPACRLQKDGSDEVWYNNKLYDVAERDRINDTLYVFLLQDEQEQNVLTCNKNYFQNDGGALSDGGHKLTTVKKAPTIIDTEHQLCRQPALTDDYPVKPSLPVDQYPLSAACAKTPSPPPKQA